MDTACALMVGVLVCNAPVAPAPLTLHGTPISNTVNVYSLAAPPIEPAIEADDEDEATRTRTSNLMRVGALVGGAVGCALGAYASRQYNDDAHIFNCLWVAGVGAGLGALAVL